MILPILLNVVFTIQAFATWSIVASNSETKEVGIAVATCLPHHLELLEKARNKVKNLSDRARGIENSRRQSGQGFDLCANSVYFYENSKGENLAIVSQGETEREIPLPPGETVSGSFEKYSAKEILERSQQFETGVSKQYGAVDTMAQSFNNVPKEFNFDWTFGHVLRASAVAGRSGSGQVGPYSFVTQGNTLSSQKVVENTHSAFAAAEEKESGRGYNHVKNCDLFDRLYNALMAGTDVDGKLAGDNRCVNPWSGEPVPATDICLIIKDSPINIRIKNDINAIRKLKIEYEKLRMRHQCGDLAKLAHKVRIDKENSRINSKTEAGAPIPACENCGN